MQLSSEIIAQAPTMERMIKSAVRLMTMESVAGKAQFKLHIFYLILRLQSLDEKPLSGVIIRLKLGSSYGKNYPHIVTEARK